MSKWFRMCLAIPLVITCFVLMGNVTPTPASAAEFILRMGNTSTYPAQPNWIMRKFQEHIHAATDRIRVDLFEGGSFGGPNEMAQGLQSGAIQAVLIPSGFYGIVAPAIGVISIPGLFDNPMELLMVLNSDTPKLDAYLEQQGMRAVAWFYQVRSDYLTLRPVHGVGDFAGMNIRTFASDINQETKRAIGANPILMSTSDLPMALQQGTVDGAYAGVSMMSAASFYDIADYLVVNLGAPLGSSVMFSSMFLESLPPDLYELVVETSRYLSIGYEAHNRHVDYVQRGYQIMRDNGVIFTYPCPEFYAAYLEATAHIAGWFLEQHPFMQPVYDELRTLVQRYRAGDLPSVLIAR